jgi:tRNA(fMet)-specific endonuclease VapC
MYLLDTDSLSHLHMGNPRIAQHVREIEDPDLATSIITKIEILRARYDFLLKASDGERLLTAQHWLARSEELLRRIVVVQIDQVAATEFDRLRRIRKLGKIGRADMLIASISIANKATLVTRNLRHFRQIPGLLLANWVDS